MSQKSSLTKTAQFVPGTLTSDKIETALHGAPIRRSVSGMAVACEPRHVTRMTAEEQSKIFAEMDPTYVHLGRDA